MAEKLSILNDPPKVLEGPQLLHELISWDQNANACALDFTKKDHRQQYTYQELQSCYTFLVARILKSLVKECAGTLHASQQHIVPLLMPQSPGLYISQLAILNSGGAFCPLNLDSPIERLKFNVGDVKAKFVITTSEFKHKFSWEDGPEVIVVEEFPQLEKEVAAGWKIPREVGPDDLAYVMYTSGSSGTPKGVGVSHLAASQSLLAHELFLPQFERFLQFAAPSFDVSVFEIFFPFKRGKTLVGCEKTQLMNDLPGIITQLQVDAAELTPGVAGSLLEKRANAPGLKLLLTIGEMLTKPVVEEFGGSETQENILYGMYGPTEAAIHCTVYPEMEAHAKPGNIGVPFETVSTFIAAPSASLEDSANLTFLPVGELGELILGGPQLARGYLNREEQNKAAFVKSEGRSYYRTGDKARQLENGTIEILGRISSGQVKLRGQRLELGEVEEAVYKHPGVKTATAAIVDKSLVVYILVRNNEIKGSQVIETCAKWLPKYMLPSEVVILKNFPYLPSGKIDKNKLNSDYQEMKQMEEEEDVALMTDTELAIKKVLDSVLGSFRPTMRLATAGLDSLMAIRAATKLRSVGFSITTIAVLQAETLTSLARMCDNSRSNSLSAAASKGAGSTNQTTLPELNGNARDLELTMACTPLQTSMLSESNLNPRAYRNWIEIELANITDIGHVTSSLEILAKANPVLRTGFVESRDSNGYVQVVWNSFRGNELEEVESFNYGFNQSKDVSLHHPVRVQILRLDSCTRLLVHIHHALYDAWSLELLLDDLDTILARKSPAPRPAFGEVVDSYQDGTLKIDDWSSKDYWKDHLANLELRELPNFHSGKKSYPALAIDRLHTSLSTADIEATARELSVSPHSIFQAAYCLVLGAYLGTTDMCFGTVFSGRTLPVAGIEDIAGPCLATLPVRVDTSTSKTLGELVKELNMTNRKHLEHSALPLRNIKSAAGVNPGRQLFDTLVIWQQTLHSYDHTREHVSLIDTVDNLEFSLTLEIIPGAGNIELKANYQQAVFPQKQINALLRQIEQLAKLAIDKVALPLASCFSCLESSLVSIENERPRTSLKLNTLSSPVERIAAEDPDRPAIDFARSIDEDNIDVQRISYSDLNNRSNQIGAYLLNEGVLPDELVCICMEKCVDLYAAILATTKVGAGYLPQTPEMPLNRLQHILKESKVKIVLAQSSSRVHFKAFSWLKVVYVDEVDFGIFSSENHTPRLRTEHVSYCVYTSGSTGFPKGVLVTQANLLSNLDVLEDLYPVSKEARFLQQCSQAFDVSVFEIFFTWRIGGCLCAAIKDVLFRDMELAIRSLNITHLSMTPSVAALVDPNNVPCVQFLVTAGEAITQKVKTAWQDRGLWQGYGPSETTNICTVKPQVTKDDAINNIGPPFTNTSAFVVSPAPGFYPLPLGGEGEFVFGGSQVFRGYVDKTKEEGKIIEHPSFGRLYRSGDFGRMLSDGSLAFTGRKDDQVKIRGQRVELGEVNNIMLKSEVVRDCVTMVIDGASGEQRLVCFWAVSGGVSPDLAILRPERAVILDLYRSLESALPVYMVPSALIPISRLPSTSQGKINRRHLINTFRDLDVEYLELASKTTQSLSNHTFTDLEKNIAQAVATVTRLPVGQVGAETSFFNLGIDSISAIALSRELRQKFDHKVEISEILKFPSVVRLGERISCPQTEPKLPTSRVIDSVDFGFNGAFQRGITKKFIKADKAVQAIYPCTPLQEAMLSAGESSSLQLYDNQVTFDVVGDTEKLHSCWRAMTQRHEILRTCFVSTDLPLTPFVQVVLERHDLGFTSIPDRKSDLTELEPPYCIDLIEINGTKKLTVAMHHALYDGVALAILYDEVEAIYKGESLPPPVSFAPFLQSMVSLDVESSDKFWATTLRDCQAPKFSAQNGKLQNGNRHSRRSQAKVSRSLKWVEDNIKKYSTSLLAVCHAIWASILAESHQESDICFGNVVSGRTASIEAIERLMAPCFNTIPARLSQADRLSYLEAFRKFERLNADSVPFHLTPLRRIQSKFSPDGSRLFDTLFILQQPIRPLDSNIWSISDDTGAMDFPLVCEIVPNHSDDTLEIILHSHTSSLSDGDVKHILESVQSKLEYALENPRRQLLSAAFKEKIIAKVERNAGIKSVAKEIDMASKKLSLEETKLAKVILNFTNIPLVSIGRDTSLFRLGLDSISIVQVAARLRKQGHHVKASDILERPTISQLSSFLSQGMAPCATDIFDFKSFDANHRQLICSKNGINADNINAVKPCTFVQQGMLATTLHSGGREYFNAVWFEILPEISISDLKNAWIAVCDSHEMLRTGFVSTEDPKYPFAMITYRKGSFKLPWNEAVTLDEQSPTHESLLRQPWSLTILTESGKNIVCFRAHHALYDAQSIQMILSDVAKIYAAQRISSRPSIDLLLGAILQSSQDDQAGKEKFWQSRESKIVVNRFPDLTPLQVSDSTISVCEVASQASVFDLEADCRSNGVTVQAAAQAAWGRLLTAYIGETSTTFGMTLSGRSAHEDGNQISFPSIVTLPVRCDVSGTNAELLFRTMEYNAALHKHQFTPLTSIQRWAGYPEGKIFDTLFAYQKLPDDEHEVEMPWKVIKEEASVDYAISMEVQPSKSGEIILRLTFSQDIIPQEHAEILLRQYDALLLDTLRNPQQLCDVAPQALSKDLVSVTSALEDILPGPVRLLHEFVTLRAQQSPDKIALEFATSLEQGNFKGKKWTYRQLDEESNRIANYLFKRGIIPGDMVAICFDKCPEASFSIIGILKAGCTYVALDPTAPNERSKFIAEDSAAKIILSRGKPAEHLKTYMEKEVIAFGSLDILTNCSVDPPKLTRTITPEDTSYCLYTSGTTGTPKGCLITHDNAVQFMLAFSRLFAGHWNNDSKYLQFASFHFDVSVMEQFWSWSVGICVASAPRDLIFEDIPGAINMLGITHIDLTPSLARLVHPDTVPTLCKGAFITGGEQLKQEILDVWGEHGVIYNGYGPTEVTIGCTMYPRVPKNGKPANIGPAYVNAGTFVLKPGTELPVLRGGVGELVVSGKLVGKGYLNRPDLTAERFPTLKEFDERVYRTGDLVRILHDGNFIFLGRADDQVKLRGQRLELSEINQVLKKSMNEIQEVVTLVLKHSTQQKEQLVSFFVLSSGPEAGRDRGIISTMRDACKAKLPGYMVPTHFIPVKAIPLNANNKADSKQLGVMYNGISVENLQQLSQSGHGNGAWSNSENKTVEIIANALRTSVEDVTRGSNIFELGLDSISIIGFSRALQSAGLENAKLSVVKSNPSIGGLVKALMENETPDHGRESAYIAASQGITAFSQKHILGVCKELGVDSVDVEGIFPCTPVQEGMIYRFLESDQPLYFNKFDFLLQDSVDSEKLLVAWDRVVARLEILRTSFVATDDGFAQVVRQQIFPSESINYEITEKSSALKLPWSLKIKSAEGSRTLALRLFHGLYDGNSLTMLLRRVIDEYRGLEIIEYGPSFTSSLPYGPLANVLAAGEFWKEHLKTWSHQLIPETSESSKDVVSPSVIQNLTGFEHLRKKLGVAPQAIVQAAWVSVLQKIISSNLTIGVVTSGRAIDYEDADKIIGPLFNTVPFHVDIKPGTNYASLVSTCHNYNMQMQDFQHTPLKNIQKWSPSKPGQPLFDTLFVFQRPEVEDEDFAKDFWTHLEDGQIADVSLRRDVGCAHANSFQYPLAFEATLSPDSTKLSLNIVAQGSAITETRASELLGQVKEALLSMIENAGQNSIASNTTAPNSDMGHPSEKSPFTPPAALSQPFKWTKETEQIREEISKLANVDENSVLEFSSIFELGLDSIDVIKLASRLKKRGIDIPVSAIIKSQTIAKMADNIAIGGTGSKAQIGKSLADISRELKAFLEKTGKLPRDVQDVLPATPLQQSMVNEMIKSDYERYFNIDGFKLNDGVSLEKLMAAVKQVVEKSPILRTTFVEIDDPKLPVSYAQIIHNNLLQSYNTESISTLPEGQSFERFMDHFKHVAVSLAKHRQELLQSQAVSVGDSKYLVIAISHALYDGSSLRNIHEDIQRAYNDALLPRPDFAPFLEQVFQSTTDEAKQFWRTTLSDLPSARFPRKDSSQVKDSGESTRLERRSRVPLREIEALCKSSRITFQTLGQTCWALVLSSLTGQLDVVFGSVLSCRDSEEAGEVMFPLMNTVAVRSVLHGSLNEMLKYMQEMSDSTRQYQHFPLGTAQAYAMASRHDENRMGDTTLFDTLFIYQGRRLTAREPLMYESVYGVSDVEFPVCVEMEIVDDTYLSWTTKCKAIARNAKDTKEIVTALENVLERLVTASHEQTLVSGGDGVSVCGLQRFQVGKAQPQQAPSRMMNVSDKWSQTELDIRKALNQISDIPEDTIRKNTTIFHLGLDSISILKLPALLKSYGIKLNVSTILKDQNIHAMAMSAQGSTPDNNDSLDFDAVLADAMSNLDISSELAELEKDVGEVHYSMPATAGQVYMIRRWQAAQGAIFYQTFTYNLPGPLDKPALEVAWSRLQARHDILRTGFIEVGPKIVQVIYKSPANDIIYYSGKVPDIVRKQNADLKVPEAGLVVEEINGRPTNLKLVLHHALYDGISLPILIEELQALYFGQYLQALPPPQSFRNFVANAIVSSASAKEKWINYLSTETLLPGQNGIERVEVFKPCMPVHDIKLPAQKEGLRVETLFLAAIARTLAERLQSTKNASSANHIVLGIYLANRTPFGEDLWNMAAPTLNLLPICVQRPLNQDFFEVAKGIQEDLDMISRADMVHASLADIYEWTGVRVNCFVNILKCVSPENETAEDDREWAAVQDMSERAVVLPGVAVDGVAVPSDGRCAAYLVSFPPSSTALKATSSEDGWLTKGSRA